jgi:hypothetical protein
MVSPSCRRKSFDMTFLQRLPESTSAAQLTPLILMGRNL